MALNKQIKKRMADAVVHSYYKSWYKRWWGKLLLFLVILTVIGILYFAVLVANYHGHNSKGDVYVAETGEWITREEFLDNRKAIGELISEDDPWLGAEEPLIYVVAYESFGCPFCKQAEEDVKKMMADYAGVVRFIAKDFPTEGLHLGVFDAHLAAACANEQGAYWEYRDILYERQTEFKSYQLKEWADELGLNKAKFNKCFDDEKYSSEIRQDYVNGIQAGVVGTPSYLVNGALIQGRIPIENWVKVIAYLLQQEL